MTEPARGLTPGLRLFAHAARIGGGLLLLGAVALPFVVVGPLRHSSHEHSRRGECRSNLKGMYVAEKSYFQDHDRYSEDLAEVGFIPERGNRYAYFAATHGGQLARTLPQEVLDGGYQAVAADRYKLGTDFPSPGFDELVSPTDGTLGLTGACPKCEMTMLCMGKIGEEPQFDVWSVSTRDRKAPDGTPIPAGSPYEELPRPLGASSR